MIVTSKGALPARDRLVELLPAGVVGVLHAQQESVGETTYGLEGELVHGRDWFEERIGSLTFHVTINAFMQTNTVMCERLYGIAIDYAQITPDDQIGLLTGIGDNHLRLEIPAIQESLLDVVEFAR